MSAPAAIVDWTQHCPLALHTYPAELAADLHAAVSTVLAADPAPAPDDPPAATGTLQLPPGAPAVIGLTGYPRTGKDVVAGRFASRYAAVARFATSDCLREEVNAFLARWGHRIVEANKPLPHYRHILQSWAAAREFEDPRYWTHMAAARIRDARAAGARMVLVTGVRSEEVIDMVRAHDGQVWRVKRPGAPDVGYHPSEHKLDHLTDDRFDAVLHNLVEGDERPLVAQAETALAVGPA